MQFMFLGTGNAAEVPVFGCECQVCIEAKAMQPARRKPSSAMISQNLKNLFLDASLHDLHHRYTSDQINGFLLTHYHMDHVQGLFPLRWGAGHPISVYGPPDELGCDDLYKHPGLLRFEKPLVPFESYQILGMEIMPLPLQHSKVTFGYQITSASTGRRLVYLTDTAGLPTSTMDYLKTNRPHVMIIDCNDPPRSNPSRNHNCLNQVIEIEHSITPTYTYLTHISHELDAWIKLNGLPNGIQAASDGLVLTI
ncbi:phosphonate metabolism protein PhnP [Thorsellia anophelis]|uniref:5-phospho-alpha-D-ribosyl 1,2-cyclic phosphate phosphodiesterase n=1 Tax=Thorsellia anophelis DSM 18579 TaxID=1123402 RepID=A0A1I0ASP7_9GAMM|nr:phosphonate metabolism protein PhnP [Thorsellia anophelis]SES96790.1 5-phospho-alpha-D-ribosyl 1,2-cyclic phosphate phosphodiesterase [Thorsellia anophelis DSM 18579]